MNDFLNIVKLKKQYHSSYGVTYDIFLVTESNISYIIKGDIILDREDMKITAETIENSLSENYQEYNKLGKSERKYKIDSFLKNIIYRNGFSEEDNALIFLKSVWCELRDNEIDSILK